jgi:hypothetical protein
MTDPPWLPVAPRTTMSLGEDMFGFLLEIAFWVLFAFLRGFFRSLKYSLWMYVCISKRRI